MAKMYYNQEEAMARLGCSEDELRDMVRSGKLREFRDAGKLNYRVEEVDKVSSGGTKSNVLGSDTSELGVDAIAEIALSPDADKGLSGSSLPGLSGSGSNVGLSSTGSAPGMSGSSAAPAKSGSTSSPIDLEGSGMGSLGLGGSTTELRLEDSGAPTSSGTQLRLEDSGAPAGGSRPGKGGKDAISLDEVDKDAIRGMKKDDTVITNIGISVFDEEDIEIAADPMAKTLMTGADEHLGLDGSGGGSGLLDLTRESDDTSLGAELLEGIDMGDTAETLAQSVQQDSSQNEPQMTADSAPLETAAMPMLAPVSMIPVEPLSPMFTGLLIAAVVVLGLAGATSVAISLDTWPSYLAMLGGLFPWSLIGTLVLGGVFATIGFLVGRSAQQGPRPPKPAKEKKAKEPKEKKVKGKKGEAAAAKG
jgi:hypothetical protein